MAKKRVKNKSTGKMMTYEFSTERLNESNTTIEQASDFLLSVMDYADERPSKINPSFTRHQIWDVMMGACINQPNDKIMSHLAVRNINREFAI